MDTLKCLDPTGRSRRHIIMDSSEVVGEIEFEIKDSILCISNIIIKNKLKGHYYQTLKYLVEKFSIKIIEAQLTNENLKIFYLSLNAKFELSLSAIFEKYSRSEIQTALETTPAMRVRKKLNFVKILEFYPAESDGLGKKTEGIFTRVGKI